MTKKRYVTKTLVKLTITCCFIIISVFSYRSYASWHLRTKPLTSPLFKHISIVSPEPYSELSKATRTALQSAGYIVTPASSAKLILYNENLQETPYTYDNTGILKENYLTYSLSFSIKDNKHKLILPKQTLTKNIYNYYNSTTLLTSNHYKQNLIKQLRAQCLTELMYKLAWATTS